MSHFNKADPEKQAPRSEPPGVRTPLSPGDPAEPHDPGGSGTTRPWSLRLRNTLVDHSRCIIRDHGSAWWSVYSEPRVAWLSLEDFLAVLGLPLTERDLPDGSLGQRWARHRQCRVWAGDVRSAPLALPERPAGGCYVAQVAVYHVGELPHFREWFYNVYLPNGLPEYLRSKYPPRSFGALGLTAAALACESMTGSPARLSDREQQLVEDALSELHGHGP